MADNTTLNAGTGGDVIASDDISGVKFQRFKLAIGADGVNDGDVASGNPLPVSLANVLADDAAFTVGTTKLSPIGGYVVAHGSNPDAADAGDTGAFLMNRHRVQFVMGGHPNVVCFSTRIPAASGAQTDLAIGPGTVGAGTKIVVTRITVTCSNANTVNVATKIGFGAASIPADTATATGSAGILVDHEGVPPGGGFTIGDGSGILGVGADGEELRFTCDSPTSGHVIVSGSYYTIES